MLIYFLMISFPAPLPLPSTVQFVFQFEATEGWIVFDKLDRFAGFVLVPFWYSTTIFFVTFCLFVYYGLIECCKFSWCSLFSTPSWVQSLISFIIWYFFLLFLFWNFISIFSLSFVIWLLVFISVYLKLYYHWKQFTIL